MNESIEVKVIYRFYYTFVDDLRRKYEKRF